MGDAPTVGNFVGFGVGRGVGFLVGRGVGSDVYPVRHVYLSAFDLDDSQHECVSHFSAASG